MIKFFTIHQPTMFFFINFYIQLISILSPEQDFCIKFHLFQSDYAQQEKLTLIGSSKTYQF